jgi:hypothetical protein
MLLVTFFAEIRFYRKIHKAKRRIYSFSGQTFPNYGPTSQELLGILSHFWPNPLFFSQRSSQWLLWELMGDSLRDATQGEVKDLRAEDGHFGETPILHPKSSGLL